MANIIITAPVRIDISGGWPDSDPYRKDFGGAVLNAAINLRVFGMSAEKTVTTSLQNVPKGSGLGASGAIRAIYLALSNPSLIEDERAKLDLIKRVHLFENKVLSQRAGFQDEAASIFGGVNYWEFSKSGEVERREIDKSQADHLEKRLVIVYTGEGHLSPNIHDLVFGEGVYSGNIPRLNRMKGIAYEMTRNVTDEQAMGELIGETWTLQKQLHLSIETDTMRNLQERLSGKYLAARATGAGGGGCMIFYTQHKENLIEEVNALKKEIKGVRVIPFNFDYSGIRVKDN